MGLTLTIKRTEELWLNDLVKIRFLECKGKFQARINIEAPKEVVIKRVASTAKK